MVDQSVFLRLARRKLNVAVAFLPRGQALPLAEADRGEITLAQRPNFIQHGLILAGSMLQI